MPCKARASCGGALGWPGPFFACDRSSERIVCLCNSPLDEGCKSGRGDTVCAHATKNAVDCKRMRSKVFTSAPAGKSLKSAPTKSTSDVSSWCIKTPAARSTNASERLPGSSTWFKKSKNSLTPNAPKCSYRGTSTANKGQAWDTAGEALGALQVQLLLLLRPLVAWPLRS